MFSYYFSVQLFICFDRSYKYKPFWSTQGCEVKERNVNMTVCICNHLTHFGILFDATGRSSTKVMVQLAILIIIRNHIKNFFSWQIKSSTSSQRFELIHTSQLYLASYMLNCDIRLLFPCMDLHIAVLYKGGLHNQGNTMDHDHFLSGLFQWHHIN